MPEISRFFGIIIRMFVEPSTQHHWAHFHAYYQNEIAGQKMLFGINFMVSVLPIAFIISWLCKMNRRSIPIAIGFHFFINICQEALQITQITKCIETGVLIIIALIIVTLNQKLFFEKPERS